MPLTQLGRFAVLCALATAGCARFELLKPTLAPAPASAPAPAVAQPVFASLPPVVAELADDRSDSQRVNELLGAADSAGLVLDSANVDVDLADVAEVAGVVGLPLPLLDTYANHDRVEHYLRLFSGDARERIGMRLSRGTRYDGMIREKLRAGGIPDDFTYLAFIESGYDPHAYSSAAAVGMWQFMSATARGVGMRVDWWIDQRRDPVRSTDAAISYLTQLNEQFGSYYLAAAAYNGGPGRVSRGLSRLAQELERTEPDDRFFALASTKLLHTETRNYVPQLIAASLIGRDPARYGIAIDTQPPFVFDSVSVPPATSLAAVAAACGIEVAEILDLNGQVLRGMTPPDGADAWLRVPPDCAEGFGEAFAGLDESLRRGAVRHTVKAGETPTALAKRAGVTVAEWRRYNPKVTSAPGTALRTGTTVLLPSREAVRASRNVPDPSIQRYGVASGGTYVVRPGDTLGAIAQRNRTTVAAIKRLNGLSSDRIIAGQKLRIGG